MYNRKCHTYNMDYVDKTDRVGSCYRIITNQGVMRYDKANETCNNDGAELLVIDNEVEQDIVASMLAEVPPTWTFYTDFTRMSGSYKADNGRAQFSTFLFMTRHGESLHEVGYAPWEDNKKEAGFDDDVCIIVNASNGMYTEALRYEKYALSYPFCEIRINKRPPF